MNVRQLLNPIGVHANKREEYKESRENKEKERSESFSLKPKLGKGFSRQIFFYFVVFLSEALTIL